jgi:diguanylate cyclase (GGDEF)-like protein
VQGVKPLLEYLINWLAYHILGSDQNMAHQMEAIQSGVSSEQAFDDEEKESKSTTQLLVRALNNLFAQVSERNKDLFRLNLSLEQKVAARTKELSDANAYLEVISLTDALTGLPNRRDAMRQLSTMWKDSVEHDTPLVCIMIDADHFKAVNDTYGHDAGDRVLVELAQTLKHSFRNDDVVCRLGGDEFFVLCSDTSLEGGVYIAEVVHKTVSELRVKTGGQPWHGSISVGVAAKDSDTASYEDLIKRSDVAVYAAKKDGKNCVRTA